MCPPPAERCWRCVARGSRWRDARRVFAIRVIVRCKARPLSGLRRGARCRPQASRSTRRLSPTPWTWAPSRKGARPAAGRARRRGCGAGQRQTGPWQRSLAGGWQWARVRGGPQRGPTRAGRETASAGSFEWGGLGRALLRAVGCQRERPPCGPRGGRARARRRPRPPAVGAAGGGAGWSPGTTGRWRRGGRRWIWCGGTRCSSTSPATTCTSAPSSSRRPSAAWPARPVPRPSAAGRGTRCGGSLRREGR